MLSKPRVSYEVRNLQFWHEISNWVLPCLTCTTCHRRSYCQFSVMPKPRRNKITLPSVTQVLATMDQRPKFRKLIRTSSVRFSRRVFQSRCLGRDPCASHLSLVIDLLQYSGDSDLLGISDLVDTEYSYLSENPLKESKLMQGSNNIRSESLVTRVHFLPNKTELLVHHALTFFP